MIKAKMLLSKLRDYEIEKYEADQEFKEELISLISEKYDGDFSTFMREEVLNEDYGSLKEEIERLYNTPFESEPREYCEAAFAALEGFIFGTILETTPPSLWRILLDYLGGYRNEIPYALSW